MRRREFTTLIGCAALLPRATRAQQASSLPRVGLVSIGADPGDPVVFRPFLGQLRELGYIEGRNISLERRFAAGRDEVIGDFVADLVQRKVDVIVVTGDREGLTAKNATSTIPIVTIVATDPIRIGLAASLARPGGNVTGLTTMDRGIYGKRIEILKQVVPHLSKTALLLTLGNGTYTPGSPWAHDVETDARSLGVELFIVETDPTNLEAAIASAAAQARRRWSLPPMEHSSRAGEKSPKAPSHIDSRRCLPSGRTCWPVV
jgi:putative ABC transport system substrate-binding protein